MGKARRRVLRDEHGGQLGTRGTGIEEGHVSAGQNSGKGVPNMKDNVTER